MGRLKLAGSSAGRGSVGLVGRLGHRSTLVGMCCAGAPADVGPRPWIPAFAGVAVGGEAGMAWLPAFSVGTVEGHSIVCGRVEATGGWHHARGCDRRMVTSVRRAD